MASWATSTVSEERGQERRRGWWIRREAECVYVRETEGERGGFRHAEQLGFFYHIHDRHTL